MWLTFDISENGYHIYLERAFGNSLTHASSKSNERPQTRSKHLTLSLTDQFLTPRWTNNSCASARIPRRSQHGLHMVAAWQRSKGQHRFNKGHTKIKVGQGSQDMCEEHVFQFLSHFSPGLNESRFSVRIGTTVRKIGIKHLRLFPTKYAVSNRSV